MPKQAFAIFLPYKEIREAYEIMLSVDSYVSTFEQVPHCSFDFTPTPVLCFEFCAILNSCMVDTQAAEVGVMMQTFWEN